MHLWGLVSNDSSDFLIRSTIPAQWPRHSHEPVDSCPGEVVVAVPFESTESISKLFISAVMSLSPMERSVLKFVT